MVENNYTLLLSRLDAFIRKYYINKLLRGSLYLVAVGLSVYLLLSYTEYHLFLPPLMRKIFFYGFLIAFASLLYIWVIDPLRKYYGLGKTINYKTASRIIGRHFSEVEDRLMNILELHDQQADASGRELIEASINQKIEKIKPVPFTRAIDLKKNKRYLRYALPPLAIFLFLLFAAPDILRDSNYRFLKNNITFERQAPFQFYITNQKLEVVQYDDYTVEVKITGTALPAAVHLISGNGSYGMVKKAPNLYSYTFNKVPGDIQFKFEAAGFDSKPYLLSAIPKPMLVNFDVALTYPSYTRKKPEVIKNTGDLVVPEGTQLQWTFYTDNTKRVEMLFPETKTDAGPRDNHTFGYTYTANENVFYKIGLANDKLYSSDTLQYQITVIPDAYPQIAVQQFKDSLDDKYFYFLGEIHDDYGFSGLNFYYKVESQDQNNARALRSEKTEKVHFANTGLRNPFTYAFDMRQFNLQPGDRVTYYFEVWDNDGLHGAKSARSLPMQFVVPTIEELRELKDEQNADMKNAMQNVMSEIEAIRNRTKELQNKFLEKKELNWEFRKQVEDLLKQQQDLQKRVEDMQNKNEENLSKQQEYLQPDEKILEKQQQLNELMQNLLTEEMKQLLEEIQKLMDELNKEQSLEELEKMDLSNQQLEQELDRMMELFKQMEMDQKLQETIDKLNELSKEQEQLSEETLDKRTDQIQNIENQEDINNKFKDIQKDLDQLQEMNQELESPRNLEDSKQSEEQIQNDLQNSSEQLNQNKNKQASQSQKSAAEGMQKMAENMQAQMNQSAMQQQQEDLNSLMRLLDNLIKLSIDQEALIYEAENVKVSNPRYVELMTRQQKIKEDTKIVEDSLIALSKRVYEISSFITREMGEVNKNLESTLSAMSDRQAPKAAMYQQYTMTGYNNLALMLDEVMQQMQQQMAQSMPGSQMCQKPGGNSQLPTMGEMQKQLNEQLKKLQGQNPDGQVPDKQGMSKQLAEMAAKQAAIREALQKMAEELGGGNTEDGKLAKQLQDLANKMDQTEEDIVNKHITEETLKRQEDILTRLLEASDAERERQTDNERQSNTAVEINRQTPPAIEEYLKKRKAELDLYKTISPELKPFYKNLVEVYFSRISFD